MKRDLDVLYIVRLEHRDIHKRLEDWARWVRPNRSGPTTHPMWIKSKSSEGYGYDELPVPIDPRACSDMEKEVGKLPPKHGVAIRWAYLYSAGFGPYRPVTVGRVCRFLAVNRPSLASLIHDGRSMLKNRA